MRDAGNPACTFTPRDFSKYSQARLPASRKNVGVGKGEFFAIFWLASVATRLWHVPKRPTGPWLHFWALPPDNSLRNPSPVARTRDQRASHAVICQPACRQYLPRRAANLVLISNQCLLSSEIRRPRCDRTHNNSASRRRASSFSLVLSERFSCLPRTENHAK